MSDRTQAAREAELFWAKVMSSGVCWEWQGAVNRDGYGVFTAQLGKGRRRTFRAHRFSYEELVGPIPHGLVLDHICRNRACVNPDHLEAVTVRENTMRGWAIARIESELTHCPAGHEYAGSNLYVNPRGGRVCRACHRVSDRLRRAEKRKTAGERLNQTMHRESELAAYAPEAVLQLGRHVV